MANINQLNKVKLEFENNRDNSKIKTIQVDKNTDLEISLPVEIIVKKDSIINLNYNEKFCGNIQIKIEKNTNVKLFENLNHKELQRDLKIDLEKNSTLIHGFSNKTSKYAFTKISLKENSIYDLKAAYFADGIENFIRFETYHLEKNTQSNMLINGAVVNNAKVICDALVNISQNAPKSSGHQKLFGLLLDNSSHILSEPILEIDNNDVTCSHGASISQISDDIEFYMKTRGYSKEQVIDLIIKGFFEEIEILK